MGRYFCRAGPKADNMFEWTGNIEGPPDSVYAGGKFLIDIKIPIDYPFSPPKVPFCLFVSARPFLKDSCVPCLNAQSLGFVQNASLPLQHKQPGEIVAPGSMF